MRCTRLAANTGRKKVAKNRHLGTIAQLCQAISSQLRHVSTIGKNLLSSNISSTCPDNMVNFGPLAAEIVSLVWGTTCKFQRVSRFGYVTAATSLNGSQPNVALCLAVSWPGTLYIHFRDLLPPDGILFHPVSFFLLLLSSFFPRLISAAGDWISTILPHMVWP